MFLPLSNIVQGVAKCYVLFLWIGGIVIDRKYIDLTGKRFGMLTVLGRDEDYILPSGKKALTWKCRCDCGNVKRIYGNALRGGQGSCGCVSKRKNLVGKRFGELTVIASGNDLLNTYGRPIATWECKCSCGKIVTVRGNQLTGGKAKSCGHLRSERTAEFHTIHGKSHDRIYGIWKNMNARCRDMNNESYGGRGITVCKDWQNDFKNFYNWAVENGYSESLTIDRIDVNGNYCPENCRWATDKEQARNTRYNRIFEYNGETKCLAEWCEVFGIIYNTAFSRISRGATKIDDICRPVRR